MGIGMVFDGKGQLFQCSQIFVREIKVKKVSRPIFSIF